MTAIEDGEGAALVADRAAVGLTAVREQAAASLVALGAGRAVDEAIHAHLARVLWRLLGSHVRDQARLWRASRPGGGWGGGTAIDGAAFAAYLDEEGWAALAARLPRLEPLVTRTLAGEIAATAELLRRAARDAAALAATLGGGGDPGALTGLELGRSDPHHGRRTVAVLSFGSGLRVVYKPRPVTMEAGLAAVLALLRGDGSLDVPAGIAVLERDGYGWCSFVTTRACADEREVVLHFRRLGALAEVLAALGATDCHADNFVAHGPTPVLVDAETLLHPRLLASPGFTLTETEIVPSRVAGPAGQRIDYPGYDGEPDAPGPNLPVLGGVVQRLRDHRAPFDEGAAQARQALDDRWTRLAAADGPLAALAEHRSRVVLRPTALYGALLVHLASATALGGADGGWERVEEELTRYRDPVLSATAWVAVQRAELAALAGADVPYLTAAATTGALHDADGTLLAAGAFSPVLPALLRRRRRPG